MAKIPMQFLQLLSMILRVGFWCAVSAYNTTKPAFFKEIINFEIADVLR
jgi:hypothetical protein